MLRKKSHLGVIICAGVFLLSIAAQGKVLFFDDFEDGKIDSNYVMMNHPGKWVEEDGVIKQTNPAPGDHTYLIMPGDFPEPHTGVVMIRIDDWADHDLSRAGLGFRLDPGDGGGYAFLIHHTLSNFESPNCLRIGSSLIYRWRIKINWPLHGGKSNAPRIKLNFAEWCGKIEQLE